MNSYYQQWKSFEAERDPIFKEVLSKFNNQPIKMLEIGASRDLSHQAHLGDGWSDLTWLDYISKNGGHLTIVELDPQALENCKIITEDFKQHVTYVQQCGLEFLRTTKEVFDFYYLDGPDDCNFTVECFESCPKDKYRLIDDANMPRGKCDTLRPKYPNYELFKCRGCSHELILYPPQ